MLLSIQHNFTHTYILHVHIFLNNATIKSKRITYLLQWNSQRCPERSRIIPIPRVLISSQTPVEQSCVKNYPKKPSIDVQKQHNNPSLYILPLKNTSICLEGDKHKAVVSCCKEKVAKYPAFVLKYSAWVSLIYSTIDCRYMVGQGQLLKFACVVMTSL